MNVDSATTLILPRRFNQTAAAAMGIFLSSSIGFLVIVLNSIRRQLSVEIPWFISRAYAASLRKKQIQFVSIGLLMCVIAMTGCGQLLVVGSRRGAFIVEGLQKRFVATMQRVAEEVPESVTRSEI